MIDYSTWKESHLKVTTLLLDPDNPRIPDSGEKRSQRDLLAELVENDKVYDLAKSIVENGYYPVEALIIVEEMGKKYVVEGNRRLAALKLLLSPESAPNELRKRRFRALANRISPEAVSKVKVIRAPTREAAAPVIMSKHTRGQVEGWEPLMKAKFYHNLVDQGLAPEDISEQYNLPLSEVTNALQQYMMYSMACALDLPGEIAKKVQNPREFPITNLERLYKNPEVTKALGIIFDGNKKVVGTVDVDEFKKGYAKIVTDVATGDIHSRKLNTKIEMRKYLASLGEHQPDLSKKGKFTSDMLLQPRQREKVERSTPTPPKRTKPKPIQRGIIPTDFSCDVENQRINDVFTELKTLPVAKFPNAVALMFRSLLEMSLAYYLERSGHLSILQRQQKAAREKKGGKLSRGWHPTLTEMLKYVVAENTDIIGNANLLRALRKFIDNQSNDYLSVETLHLLVHNQHFYPNEDTLRGFWPPLQGLFEIILVEPDGEDDDNE